MWADLRQRVRALLWRAAVERELADELRFHLEHQIAKHRAAGMTAEEAERQAHLELGGVEQVKEECRQTWGVARLETVLRDVRHGWRALRRSPGVTAVVVLSLG